MEPSFAERQNSVQSISNAQSVINLPKISMQKNLNSKSLKELRKQASLRAKMSADNSNYILFPEVLAKTALDENHMKRRFAKDRG